MRFNCSNYADFKVITNKLTTPVVIYSVAGTDVHNACSTTQSGDVFAYASSSGMGQIFPIVSEATLLADFPAAGKVAGLSVS